MKAPDTEKDVKFLAQQILWDEIICKFDHENLDYLEGLAWSFTQVTERYIHVKNVIKAVELIRNDLCNLRDKYFDERMQK